MRYFDCYMDNVKYICTGNQIILTSRYNAQGITSMRLLVRLLLSQSSLANCNIQPT